MKRKDVILGELTPHTKKKITLQTNLNDHKTTPTNIDSSTSYNYKK